jgi:hypothetical protein
MLACRAYGVQQAILPAKLKAPGDGPEKGGEDVSADFQELIWI